MPHPAIGLPPSDPTVGLPDAAARLRRSRARIGQIALQATLRIDPTFQERHDELALRRILRDYDQHVEQLARALETGEDRFVVQYAEWLVPIYRRRRLRMNDVVTTIQGLREGVMSALTADTIPAMSSLMDRWIDRLRRHRRLPGDHRGNALVRLIWKGAGLGDDTVV
jgi:hypothetical protein